MRVAVLGCGRWGTFLAWYACRTGHETMLWGRRDSAKFARLQKERRNEYLELSKRVKLSSDLAEAMAFGELIIISISSQALRGLAKTLRSMGAWRDKTFVLCMKGLELGSGKRLSEVFCEEMGKEQRVAVWVGPGHVQDFTHDIPNCMVIGAESPAVSEYIVAAMSSDLIRFYYGGDLLGIEIGAAAKNVIGIAAGMLDGMKYSSLKGALMARGTKELSRLIESLGGDAMTVYGLSHLGDYEATLFSAHSNNRRFGEGFVEGRAFNQLAEGVSTVEALVSLAQKQGIDMPICRAVHAIVAEGADARRQLLDLFLRPVKAE